MKINFMSSKDGSEKCQIHSKSNMVEIMIGFDKNEINNFLIAIPL